MNFNHISVLLDEAIQNLNINKEGVYIDGTLGGGGHSKQICKYLSKKGLLIGIDQDIDALEHAKSVLKCYDDITIFIRDNFSNIKNILKDIDIPYIDGMVMDLGVSSYQLDEADRGFSYMQDAKLDMRMDNRNNVSAYEIVNNYKEEDLFYIIKNYGEERWAKRIAQFIVEQRQKTSISTTFELVDVIKKAIPKKARENGPHPAKRTFQAIRIEVNNELKIIEDTIKDVVDILNPKGRLCIITFHSLEDRIVKNTFKNLQDPCTCPIEFPICMCNKQPKIKIITKKPIIPSKYEILNNPRARSAKLRVIEKL